MHPGLEQPELAKERSQLTKFPADSALLMFSWLSKTDSNFFKQNNMKIHFFFFSVLGLELMVGFEPQSS
jgi:hypothetical protein